MLRAAALAVALLVAGCGDKAPFYCTSDGQVGICSRTHDDCEDRRSRAAIEGLSLGPCQKTARAACYRFETADDKVGTGCFSSKKFCQMMLADQRSKAGVDTTVTSDCEVEGR